MSTILGAVFVAILAIGLGLGLVAAVIVGITWLAKRPKVKPVAPVAKPSELEATIAATFAGLANLRKEATDKAADVTRAESAISEAFAKAGVTPKPGGPT